MASTTTYFSLLLLTLLFSLHVHARDSQFFSKVTNNNNNPQELVPSKTELQQQQQQQPLMEQEPNFIPQNQQTLNKPEQEPNFIPQNQQNSGYGLYGHESGQLPPSTTENLPYKTETQNPYNKDFNPSANNDQYYNKDVYVNPESFSNSRNDQFYNNDAYVNPESRNERSSYNNEAYVTSARGNNNYYNGDNMYNNRQQGIGETKLGVDKYSNGNNMFNNEKYGMSDTRFLDNGKYYYHPASENNYNFNNNNNENVNVNSRGFESRNEVYNNRGNYGNSYRGQYGNNENSYQAKNSMEGYNQNQNQNQEFQEDEQQFMP